MVTVKDDMLVVGALSSLPQRQPSAFMHSCLSVIVVTTSRDTLSPNLAERIFSPIVKTPVSRQNADIAMLISNTTGNIILNILRLHLNSVSLMGRAYVRCRA